MRDKLHIALALLPAITGYIYFYVDFEVRSFAGAYGLLAFAFAGGGIMFYHIRPPKKFKRTETAFGVTGRYKNPVHGGIIPKQGMVIIFGGIAASVLLAAICDLNGF